MIQQKIKNTGISASNRPIYKTLILRTSRAQKHLCHSKTINECMNKYPNCFWLDCYQKYKKISLLMEYIDEILDANFILVGAALKDMEIIKDIKFNNLRVLCLESNRIYSLEPIGTIWMPVLEELSLRNSCIVAIKALRKMLPGLQQGKEGSPRLKKLALDGNKIFDISALTSTYFELSSLFLDIATYDTPCGIDLRPLAKIANPKKCYIAVNSFFRLKQERITNIFGGYI